MFSNNRLEAKANNTFSDITDYSSVGVRRDFSFDWLAVTTKESIVLFSDIEYSQIIFRALSFGGRQIHGLWH